MNIPIQVSPTNISVGVSGDSLQIINFWDTGFWDTGFWDVEIAAFTAPIQVMNTDISLQVNVW